jgi:histidyl-tRNA synthetase
MCPTCRERFERNPLRILDCKVSGCKEIVKGAPVILDYICDDCKNHMNDLEHLLQEGGIEYQINPNIVRGLDYYTKTVFEFVTTALGSQGTVCGGGRYNHLVESVGGKPTPCVGFGLGLERLLMLLDALGKEITDNNRPDLFVICQNPALMSDCRKIVAKLRAEGIASETEYTGRSVKAQFRYADKQNAKFVTVIGESEIQSGKVTIKKLSDGTQEETQISDIATFILERK